MGGGLRGQTDGTKHVKTILTRWILQMLRARRFPYLCTYNILSIWTRGPCGMGQGVLIVGNSKVIT